MFKSVFGSVVATMAAADINADFHDLIHGEETLHMVHMKPVWEQFKEEFTETSPVDLEDESKMFTFFENLEKVIEHNKKEDKTYSRGINKFSAMTFEEFSNFMHFADN